MKPEKINLNQLYSTRGEMQTTPNRMSLSRLFGDSFDNYINELSLFLINFNSVPNAFYEKEVDCIKANKWFIENYGSEIKDFHFSKRYLNQSKAAQFDDLFYVLFDDLIVYFNTNVSTIKFLFRKTDIKKVETIVSGVKRYKRKARRTPELCLLINTPNGLSTKTLKIQKPKLNIEYNYNDDFKEIHQTILKRLSKNNDKGLVLLHGKPGTGKTSYIRYLISMVKKVVIFMPPSMAGGITDPDLIAILIENPNSILVIEDAENIIMNREKSGQSRVSALLNISDGLLSDCLNIQIICSFNTDISKIDSALMRKGRLIAKYEFKELGIEKAQSLSDKLSFNLKIYKPMTLTEIYNQEEKEFTQIKEINQIGFRAGVLNRY